jgi:protocatechuate 3,4-dioxygenase beta subunit
MHGVVQDLDTKKGIPGAVIDIWQASANGKYDFQDPENQEANNLRGKFTTNEKGEYHYYCYKPTAYSLPTDGMSQLTAHPQSSANLIEQALLASSSEQWTAIHSAQHISISWFRPKVINL